LDFLKALNNEGEVRVEFKDSQSAGQMRPEDPDAEYKYRYVLMPMRSEEGSKSATAGRDAGPCCFWVARTCDSSPD